MSQEPVRGHALVDSSKGEVRFGASPCARNTRHGVDDDGARGNKVFVQKRSQRKQGRGRVAPRDCDTVDANDRLAEELRDTICPGTQLLRIGVVGRVRLAITPDRVEPEVTSEVGHGYPALE